MCQVLEADECMYAVSQGAVAVECRADDGDTLTLLSLLSDYTSVLQCITERAFLRRLASIYSV